MDRYDTLWVYLFSLNVLQSTPQNHNTMYHSDGVGYIMLMKITIIILVLHSVSEEDFLWTKFENCSSCNDFNIL